MSPEQVTLPVDPSDRRLALAAAGPLARLNRAGVLEAADVHVASRMAEVADETDAEVLLAAALAVRAVREGATALSLADPPETSTDDEAAPVEWPDPDRWLETVRASALVAAGVLRVDLGLVYLDRYWREEVQVRDDLVARLDRPSPDSDPSALEAGAVRVFPAEGYDEQRAASRAAAAQWTTVLTGGPGTGKTATVAGLLALLAEQDAGRATSGRPARPLRIGLCAPTGKAAARLQESVESELARLPRADRERVGDLQATTLHRLLGWKPGSSVRFRHDRDHRLPHDVVVVDETSMVSLTLMARLLEALRADTRLVLVGDKDQLASVDAGAVLADLVEGLTVRAAAPAGVSPVHELRTSHRFTGDIAALAEALRTDDVDIVLDVLTSADDQVVLIDPDDAAAKEEFTQGIVDHAETLARHAGEGAVEVALSVLDRQRLLCAHREGPFGVTGWNRTIERRLAERTGLTTYDEWYPGRPVLVLANDVTQTLYNGDVGVVVRDGADPDRPDRLRVALQAVGGPRLFAPTRLPEVQTMHAMTIHKSQGSQAAEVRIVLPPEDSPLLTHELLYTAVTRAQERVRILGTEAAVRAAVTRRVRRASGLAQRFAGSGHAPSSEFVDQGT